MKQIVSFITLGVKDLLKMSDFYKNIFGWSTLKEEESIVFFKMNGFILGLFPVDELAKDIGISDNGSGFKRMSFAVNFNSEAEVDEHYLKLLKQGVKIIKPPGKVFWGGYHCYIADPENNYWELAFNPFLVLNDSGEVDTHQ